MRIGIGISQKSDIISALQEVIKQAKKQLTGERPNIGFIFTSMEFASPVILKTLNLYFPQVPIVGATTLAIPFNSRIYRRSLILCLISSENLKVAVAAAKDIKKKTAFVAGQELGIQLLKNFGYQKRNFAMLFCDGLLEEGSKFLAGLQEKLGTSFPIAGASASDNLRFKQTYLYFNNELITDAAVGILWGGKIKFNMSIHHGWKPLGKTRRVTKSKGNLLIEIDNQPAANFYKEYFAKEMPLLKKDLKYISTLYPIGLYLEGEKEYILRNIIAIEEDGSLICQGDVPQDSIIRIMIGTKDSCLSATRQTAEDLVKASPAITLSKNNIDVIFIFDSVSRYILLKRSAEEELKTIQETVPKEINLFGLYTYGEQAPLKAITYEGKTYFHNQSIVLTAVGE